MDVRLAQFQELLAEQADIRREDQQLLFENHDFEKIVKPLQAASTYPHTSAQNPIYLFSNVHSLITMPPMCIVRKSLLRFRDGLSDIVFISTQMAVFTSVTNVQNAYL